MSAKSDNSLLKNSGDQCDPKEIALKSFFLGPQAENINWLMALVNEVLLHWADWRKSLYPSDGLSVSLFDQQSKPFIEQKIKISKITRELLTRFEEEIPKFSPRYVGHMFSEVSLPALMGHLITLLHNPNNISGESSRVGTQIEDEAVGFLREMVGYPIKPCSGHFTSGGTLANFEALVRARARASQWLSVYCAEAVRNPVKKLSVFQAAQCGWKNFDSLASHLEKNGVKSRDILKWDFLNSGPYDYSGDFLNQFNAPFQAPVFLVPENKHYSWKKACTTLGFGKDSLWPISLTDRGVLSIKSLSDLIQKAEREDRTIVMVVSVLGSTELGSIDPVHEVQALLDEWKNKKGIHIWHHVDGAYGGFYRALDLSRTKVITEASRQALLAVAQVDSITLDPHKLGYVPYSSGAIIVRNARDYRCKSIEDAPYIDFDENIDRGQFTIEGSRSAAGAVATWMLAKSMGLKPDGYGLLLERTTRICREFDSMLRESKLGVQIAPGCDTNIICFICAKKGEALSVSNQKTLDVYRQLSKPSSDFFVSKTALSQKIHGDFLKPWFKNWQPKEDQDEVVLIRMCMMNPFFGSHEANVYYPQYFLDVLNKTLCGVPMDRSI